MVKEDQSIQCLVLAAGRHLPLAGQLAQEPLDFVFAGKCRRHFLKSYDVAAQPVHVRGFRGDGFMLAANHLPQA